MAYNEIGKFSSDRGTSFETAMNKRKPWTFHDKVTFWGPDNQLVIERGTLLGIWYTTTPGDTGLSAAVDTYESVRTLTLGPAGTYMVFTNGYIEAALSADVDWWGSLTINGVGGSSFAWTRTFAAGASHTDTFYEQLSPHGTVTTASAGATVTFQVRRSSTNGTQLMRQADISAIRIA